MTLQITSDHKLYGYGEIIGAEAEHHGKVLEIQVIPPAMRDMWLYLEFETPDGKVFTTEKLEMADGVAIYPLPSSLMQAGRLGVQAILRNGEGTVLKTDVRQFEVSPSLNASDTVEAGSPDFMAQAQAVLEACEIASEKVDTVVAAEESRVNAELERVSAESQRQAAESTRSAAEAERDAAYSQAEMVRDTTALYAEMQRKSQYEAAEETRNTAALQAEGVRETVFEEMNQERATVFKASETARHRAFTDAQALREDTFTEGENARWATYELSEAERVSAETKRQSAEDKRILAEAERVGNESQRMKAEEERRTAESQRTERLDAIDRKIYNLEHAALGVSIEYISADSMAYAHTVPENAQRYAAVKRMGGSHIMAGQNYLPTEYYHGKSYLTNGIQFTKNDDGSVHAVGTSTSVARYYLTSRYSFSAGTYIASDFTVIIARADGTSDYYAALTPFSIYDGDTVSCYLAIAEGSTQNKTYYPKLDCGSTPTAFTAPGEGGALTFAPVTEILCKRKDGTTVASYPISEEILSLPDYGVGLNRDTYNYIDFEKEVYVRCCYVSGGDVDICPTCEQDISAYLNSVPRDYIEVEADGTVEFVNQAGLFIPATLEYLVRKE